MYFLYVNNCMYYRYCYAGLRKKIKLEVPQLPVLGESSKVFILYILLHWFLI